ncbi:ABC transporter substrate-binding protein [Cumulibacter soli]|uniref:ABC transporter substrate-binding protein n=1 Tax=Cumulibacter soli TaxID=2546344 RepID=UPI001067CE58|nr:ABC transporter substrate-binding protein [Cumulibacter soli]
MKGSARVVAAITGVAALLLSACGSSDDDGGSNGANDGSGVTVTTKFGDVSVPEDPERVVVIGGAWTDTALALGVEPVAAGGVDLDNAPWLDGVIDESIVDDELLGADGSVNREKVASYKPDVIIVQPFSINDEAAYDALSEVAPVVTGMDVNDSWTHVLDVVAQSTGTTDKAEEITADVDAKAADLSEAAPELAGKTYQWVRYDQDQLYFGNGSLLDLLGLEPGTGQDNTMNTSASISRENLPELDADVVGVFCYSDCTPLKDDPRLADLPSSKYGSLFFPDLALAVAINSASPLTVQYVFDELGPQLTEAAPKMAK